MCDNIHNCCRICLDDERERVSILKDPSIQLHLRSCLALSVTEDDELPKVVCVICVKKLSDFYNFQLNATCSQDWLDTVVREKMKKQSEQKVPVQPLPDSEYNSDSLLEFLNNTENIEEYLNNLGKEDIPSIVNMFDKNNENSIDIGSKQTNSKTIKIPSPKKKDAKSNYEMNMEIDVLDSDIEIVKELLMKETNVSKTKQTKTSEKNVMICFACKLKFDSLHKLTQHYSVCDKALRMCIRCNMLFDSKQKLLKHKTMYHATVPCTCNCGQQFNNKDKLVQHYEECIEDFALAVGCVFRCKQCGDVFRDRLLLYKHAKEHVLKAQMKLCSECGHNFAGETALATHKKKEHPTPANQLYRCKVCHLSSRDRRELYNHIQEKHTLALEPQQHLCESCGKSFSTRATLMRHSHTHAPKGNSATFVKQSSCVTSSVSETNIVTQNVSEHNSLILGDMCMCELCGTMVSSITINVHKKAHISL